MATATFHMVSLLVVPSSSLIADQTPILPVPLGDWWKPIIRPAFLLRVYEITQTRPGPCTMWRDRARLEVTPYLHGLLGRGQRLAEERALFSSPWREK